ncbi:MAG: aspartate aminotransferase family protein [Thermodesulfobacteriota bacterium]
MTNKEIIDLTEAHVLNTYRRFPVAMVRGQGTRVWDASDKEYLDFTSGIAVCNLGHCHMAVVKAIQEQADKLIHISNLYHIEPQARLAKLLTESSFAEKVFFCNSGAEANEAAIKLARKFFSDKGQRRFKVLSMEKSFHGRSFATLAATGQEKVRKGFEPFLEKFTYIPFNDLEAVKGAIDSETAAVMVEPIQGEGGVNLPDPGYLKGLKDICEQAGVLLIFDEVQVGVGRTGKLFAYEHYGTTPHIMTLAKALGGGMAIGAMLVDDEVAGAFGPGSHASTFGGNPLATAAAHATLRTILDEGLLGNCVTMGEYILSKLRSLKEKYSFIRNVRGKGLIIGMEVEAPVGEIVGACLDKGLLVIAAGDNVLRFLPPLTVSAKEVDEMVKILDDVLTFF